MKNSISKLIIVIVFFAVIFLSIFSDMIIGVNGFGPTKSLQATVLSKHIDYSKNSNGNSKSHYMVTTTSGTFEVDNGWMLGVYNADEIYGSLIENHNYIITTKGNKFVGYFYQYYPYVISATKLD